MKTTMLLGLLVVSVLCAWGRAQMEDYQTMEHTSLNSVKVEPEVKQPQQQREPVLSDTNRIVGAFLKRDVPTTKKARSTSPRAYPTQLPVGQTFLGEEGRKQIPGKFMEEVNRMLAESGPLLTGNLEQQIEGQAEGRIARGKPNEGGRMQASVDVAIIQRIVREEVAKLKAASPIDFAVELARHKEVIQKWMNETGEGRTAAQRMWIQGNLGWSFAVAAILAFTSGFLVGKLTTLLHHNVSIPIPDGKPAPCRDARAAKTTESNNSQVGSPGSSSKSRNKKRSKAE